MSFSWRMQISRSQRGVVSATVLLAGVLWLAPAWAQSWGWPPVGSDTTIPIGEVVILGDDVFAHTPFLADWNPQESQSLLPIRFQEDPLAASSLPGYLQAGRELGFGRSFLKSTGLCRYFSWSDLFSWFHFRRTGELRFFSPTFMFVAPAATSHYARHMQDYLNQVPGALFREDDVYWLKGKRYWPNNSETITPLLQSEVSAANLKFFLYTNPHLDERQLVVRNTDREIPLLDEEGQPQTQWGRVLKHSPNPDAYEQMNWGTVVNVREHLRIQKTPLVIMYAEPGGRTLTPVVNEWTDGLERADRSWTHAVLVLGFNDDTVFDDMSMYHLSQERRAGVPRVPQTSFWPSRGVFFIRDSFNCEVTMMSYAKFLRLGILAEGLVSARN